MATQRGSSHRSCKKWLKGFLLVFLFLLLVTAAFNFETDCSGIFRPNKGLKGVALNLINGKMVAGYMGRNDERELERLIVENYPGQRDTIALGSSRTMVLRKRFIRGGNVDFFNNSVSGAIIEDYIAIVGLYRRKGVLPKTVIIGIDPWIFNKNNRLGSEFWRVLESYYREMVAEFPKGARGRTLVASITEPRSDVASSYEQLINLEYTLQNWDYLQKGKKLYVTDTVNVDDIIREPDGSVDFPYNLRFGTMAQIGLRGLPPIIYRDFEALSGTELFEDLLHYLKTHGVAVVLLLPPLHPDVYQACLNDPKYSITIKVEAYLRQLARDNGFTMVGSFDPGKYGFRAEDFADEIHGHESVMKRLFETYR
ncbi:MAG TPA: hypothetical protein VKF36_05800 [Syntrophorhabdales bacterium]|nr:hypothetical protein [Syntrophorhabdales bacterium]